MRMRLAAGASIALGIAFLPLLSARAEDDTSVEIHDNFYSPEEIHVVEGGTVTWTNLGGAHSVSSDDGISFDSSPACIAGLNCMATGESFTVQFRAPETLTYHCRVHGNAMVGKVVVESTSTTSSSTTSTTLDTTTTSSDASAAPPASDQPTTITQFPLPSLPASQRPVALPRRPTATSKEDDTRPWALIAIGIAGSTAIAAVVLVRRGRVPFG